MTKRLYYDDAYCVAFQAKVIDRFTLDNRQAVILDHTYFYPTSGGQPHDTGHIGGMPVVDVTVREHDDEVLHIVDGLISSDTAEAEIDWTRRFDHMQQHTGQHILSQAFIRVANAPTLSFHLGVEIATIDLPINELTPEHIGEAELLANEIIWEDRPLHIRYASQSELEEIPLRKVPDLNGDRYRLVEIEDFDLNACGGTHVSRTGEVGIIKIVKIERRGDEQRVEFHCGRRALNDYREKNEILNNLSVEFTTSIRELERSVEKLQAEAKLSKNSLKKQTKRLITLEAEEMLHRVQEKEDSLTVISEVFQDRPLEEIRMLANQIVRNPKIVAVFGQMGERSQLVFASSGEIRIGMDQVLAHVLPKLEDGSGGGSAKFAQGSGQAASTKVLQEVLDQAREIILESEGLPS
jgi:alanyl-tRNA synthetase